jgi:hypothetical protein
MAFASTAFRASDRRRSKLSQVVPQKQKGKQEATSVQSTTRTHRGDKLCQTLERFQRFAQRKKTFRFISAKKKT